MCVLLASFPLNLFSFFIFWFSCIVHYVIMPYTIIITGTSTGLGRDMALTLARNGHHVMATMRNAQNRKEGISMRAIAKKEHLHLHTIDHEVTSPESTANCLGACFQHSPNGKIDVLINNAGVGGKVEAVEMTPVDDFPYVMDINFNAPVSIIKMLLPHMRENGKGSIINVTSVAAQYWMAGQASYCASKAALEAFSTCLSQEMRRFGVQVSTLQPGVVFTPILLKDQTIGNPNSPYAAHIRLHKKFYTSMMATIRTRPKAVSKVVLQILNDFEKEDGQKMHYTAGADAALLDDALREKGYEWLAKAGGKPFINDDQKHVDFYFDEFGLDVSATFKKVDMPSAKM